MKKIRRLTTLLGLLVLFATMGVTGVKAQVLSNASFTGSLTLPSETHWGSMTLPAGTYTLDYGSLGLRGLYVVEITGQAKDSPHGFVRVLARNSTAAGENTLVCVREGNADVVRGLEMPSIGQSVTFAIPKGTEILAQQRKSNKSAQTATARMTVRRIHVAMK